MTQTDTAVLDQACRNTRGSQWIAGTSPFCAFRPPLLLAVSSADHIRAEYRRLLRLKRHKKRWQS